MSRVQQVAVKFDGPDAETLLHAIRHYENHWSALVLSADHIRGQSHSQEMALMWRRVRSLRLRIEKEIEGRSMEGSKVGPDSMDIL